ncbi:MAG: hypothetical protein CR954_00935 [Candidatus Moraniibacteriota bacterium]|nr:MAG: hypothetical protein CR954_00935 [Candidatus Moranbacteria bacterium]
MIYENIRRIFIYLIADDFSELFLFFVALFCGWPLPLLPMQILWINVIEDSFPNIALTTEYDSTNLMNEPPRNPKAPIITKTYKMFMLLVFCVSGLSAVLIFWLINTYCSDVALARTATFTLIAFDSIAFVFTIRNLRRYTLRKDMFSNRFVNASVVFSLVLLLVGLYVPFFAHYLGTVPLGWDTWTIIVCITIIEMGIFEYAKKRFFITKSTKSAVDVRNVPHGTQA